LKLKVVVVKMNHTTCWYNRGITGLREKFWGLENFRDWFHFRFRSENLAGYVSGINRAVYKQTCPRLLCILARQPFNCVLIRQNDIFWELWGRGVLKITGEDVYC